MVPVSKRASLKSHKILIVKMGAIGDVIMTIPGAFQLHQQGFEIEWICGKVARPLLECYSWVRLHLADESAILKGSAWQRVRSIAAVWQMLFLKQYELCATLYYDRRFRVLTLPVRARRRVILSNYDRSAALVPGRSYADEFARILLAIPDQCRSGNLMPLRPDRLPDSPLSAKVAARRIAIVPGGASNLRAQQTLKRWPVESYVALAQLLRQRRWEVVLLGGPEDAWVRPYFHDLEIIDTIDRLSLPEVISACDSCDAVVTHDTGPMHLAGLSTACLVAIFGPTNPDSFLPRRPGVVGIWSGQNYSCRPCYDGRGFPPCPSAGCMREVRPELVIQQLDQLLDCRSRNALTDWQIISPVNR